MENILYNISQVLGITIIHSLWQGLLIYFLLRIALLFTASLSSSRKYTMAVTSLLAITAWFAYTLVNEIQVYDWLAKPTSLSNMPLVLELPANLRQINEQTMRYYYSFEKYLPYVTLLYVAGLLLNGTRLILARKKLNAIKQTMSIAVPLQQQMSRFADKLNITQKVTVGLSNMVDVPCITGYFKPIILLPFTLSTYLSSEEIEAILMHELAHIKRNDYLINLLQQVITTLLFFNPCVLLINKIIGEERENSCDDLVVDVTQNPVIYAKALFKLEQSRQNQLQLALAVTGKKYHLLNRIERIMKTKKQIPSVRPTLVAMLILTLSICSLALLNPEIAEGKISVKAIAPAIKSFMADTVPVKKTAKALKSIKAQKLPTKNIEKSNKALIKEKFNTDKVYAKDFKYDWNYNDRGMEDPELERLGKEVEKHGDAISKYYDSPEFKAKSEEMEKLGKQIDAFYNSPQIKEATAAQEKAAADFEKAWGGKGSEMESTGKEMEVLGKKMDVYFNSPEFKAMNEKLEDKYGVTHDGFHDDRDENYKKYQAELDKNLSPEIKETTKKMRDLGAQMRARHNDPELKKAQENMRIAGENMRKAFNNPDIKTQQEKMRQIGQQMRDYNGNEQIKKERDLLQQSTAKMRAYMKTPEFKAKLKEYKRTHQTYNWHKDVDEQPEKPEQPAAPEKPEAPESN